MFFSSSIRAIQLFIVFLYDKTLPHPPEVLSDEPDSLDRLGMFHFLKAAASEEFDKLNWDSDLSSPECSENDELDEELFEITKSSRPSFALDTKLKITPKSCKKNSKCKGIVRR
jgi:hypothetical protein